MSHPPVCQDQPTHTDKSAESHASTAGTAAAAHKPQPQPPAPNPSCSHLFDIPFQSSISPCPSTPYAPDQGSTPCSHTHSHPTRASPDSSPQSNCVDWRYRRTVQC